MDRFRYGEGELRFRITDFECELLSMLVSELSVLVSGSGESVELSDEFARWQAEFSGLSALDFSDPAVARLFPAAYVDDLAASDEFLRLTQTERRLSLISDVGIVRQGLAQANPIGRESVQVTISNENLDVWLRTVNILRTVLAVRLGIVAYDDIQSFEAGHADGQMAFLYGFYGWLGYLIEGLTRGGFR
jgi:hypothetical protein